MSWIGMMVCTLLGTVIGMDDQGVGVLVMPWIGAIFGFIPVFMYGAWLGAQIGTY